MLLENFSWIYSCLKQQCFLLIGFIVKYMLGMLVVHLKILHSIQKEQVIIHTHKPHLLLLVVHLELQVHQVLGELQVLQELAVLVVVQALVG